MAINGSAESCTSHASMPPGLTTRSMVIACAAAAASHNPMPATSAVSARVPLWRRKAEAFTSVSPRAGRP